MIYVITHSKTGQYFACTTTNDLRGGIQWCDTPELAIEMLCTNYTTANHSASRAIISGIFPHGYNPSTSIHSSYSPEEYPEFFI